MFRVEITDREILECRHPKAALRMSLYRSGRSMYAVALECGMSESHLSRCLNQDDTLNLSHERTLQFMVSCGNAIYLRWQYLYLKELLPELENDDGACIASEVAELRQVLSEAISEIKAARPFCQSKNCCCNHGRYVPRWLKAEVLLIEHEARMGSHDNAIV